MKKLTRLGSQATQKNPPKKNRVPKSPPAQRSASGKNKTISEWGRLAQKRIMKTIEIAFRSNSLRKSGPKQPWQVSVQLVGSQPMAELNFQYRGKNYATDVLSFSAPRVFWESGHLGELVICLPVLKSQAKSQGHSAERELDVLLVHGLLHLLGFDHELGAIHAQEMAKWEQILLERMRARGPSKARFKGLIERSSSGIDEK